MNPGQENAMRIKAAIFRTPNQPLTIEEVDQSIQKTIEYRAPGA